MTTPTCATCRFFKPSDLHGRCRRSPHVLVPLSDMPMWEQPLVEAGDWCGEHTTAEPVGVPQLPVPPLSDLPSGWEWNNSDDHTAAKCHTFGTVVVRGASGSEIATTTGYVRVDVLEAVIAAHRARGVR